METAGAYKQPGADFKNGKKRRYRRIFFSISALAGVLLLLYKATHYKCDRNYTGPRERDEALLEYYDYPRQVIDARSEDISEQEKYVIKRVRFSPAVRYPGIDGDICIYYYEQKENGKFPAVLVLPIAGGISSSVKSFAGYFAAHGFNCAVVQNRKIGLDRGAEYIESFLRQSITDNRQVLDYLARQEKVDADRLGSLGISLGGIDAAMTTAVDERLKCSVIIIAGGSIADVLCHSKDNLIRRPVDEVADKRGLTLDQLHSELSEKIKSDPVKLAPYMDARNISMYIALFDRTVPRECGVRLWEAAGRPEVTYVLTGHYSAILYLPYVKMRSLGFLREKLGT